MGAEDSGPESVERATEACLRLLARRGRSGHELRLALARKGFPEAVADQVLEKLQRLGYLDDARFARERAASLLERGRLGPRAVLERLRAHGLEDSEARRALAAAREALEFDPLATARQVLDGRGLLGGPLQPRDKARAARLLLGRGFSQDVVERLLGEASLYPSGGDD